MFELRINGKAQSVDVPADMPLLWVLRDVLALTGTKFGCGIAQCRASTVHVDGQAMRSCVLPVGSLGDRPVTTIEAVGDTPAGQKIQQAWLDVDVVQCGYCQSGQIMSATAGGGDHRGIVPDQGRIGKARGRRRVHPIRNTASAATAASAVSSDGEDGYKAESRPECHSALDDAMRVHNCSP
jgi:aerobic-type carbon monoxide dehydrogenase small subunit (CoxS/CutS family)